MHGGKKISVDNLAQQIAKRAAEQLTPVPNAPPYSHSYRSKLIRSRRVYSLEIPRKCLEMIEILGEGNFGQVWKARSHQLGAATGNRAEFVAVKTNKCKSNYKCSCQV